MKISLCLLVSLFSIQALAHGHKVRSGAQMFPVNVERVNFAFGCGTMPAPDLPPQLCPTELSFSLRILAADPSCLDTSDIEVKLVQKDDAYEVSFLRSNPACLNPAMMFGAGSAITVGVTADFPKSGPKVFVKNPSALSFTPRP